MAAEVPSYGLALYLGVHFKRVIVSGEPNRILLFTSESSESEERNVNGAREHLPKGTPPNDVISPASFHLPTSQSATNSMLY